MLSKNFETQQCYVETDNTNVCVRDVVIQMQKVHSRIGGVPGIDFQKSLNSFWNKNIVIGGFSHRLLERQESKEIETWIHLFIRHLSEGHTSSDFSQQ